MMNKKDQSKGKTERPKRHGDFSAFTKKQKPKFKFEKKESRRSTESEKTDKSYKTFGKQRTYSKAKYSKGVEDEFIRLNKFIADAGICSRREADVLIEAGAVKVNGKVVTKLGTKVSVNDNVIYGDQALSREKLQYILLNKPKGYITTTDDPYERKTIMLLLKNACKERIYPVGRLDKNTTGLLLITNDGALAKRLTHPKHNVKKVYHIVLDKTLKKNDMNTITNGITLDDGFIKPDGISYVDSADTKKEIGMELHSGRNRIVRRLFESLGYKVTKLDRVMFAGLTKKEVPRGRWRHLSDKEVGYLKML